MSSMTFYENHIYAIVILPIINGYRMFVVNVNVNSAESRSISTALSVFNNWQIIPPF